MKKYNFTSLLALCSLTIVLLNIACNQNNVQPANTNLFGTWHSGSAHSRYIVELKSDSTVILTKEITDVNGVLRYTNFSYQGTFRHRTEGVFFDNMKEFVNQDAVNSPDRNTYVQVGAPNMVATGQVTILMSYTWEFAENGSKLLLNKHCFGATSLTCTLGTGSYTRQ